MDGAASGPKRSRVADITGSPRLTVGSAEDRHPRSRLAQVIGPCYTPTAIARVLGHDVEQILELTDGCCILALTTADDEVVYPAFQVHNGGIVRGLPPILRALRRGIDDPWTWALWLQAATPSLGRHRARGRMEELIDGEFDRVFTAAVRSADSWRS